ncbi:bifunctional RNase H/acid phosphatase [Acrocarpospora catenulata]|uniref:bifunctional RNase H/acid phosphatase n=1 Tax=Acrocarpospora catenulata TaxID=2836182 RepID=UPI001BD95F51|nr:bifunctional RNase H/acid phosphatase [Acrocarpospora catenulata]
MSGSYVIEADGGSRGNPGPAGYGAVVRTPSGEVLAEAAESIGVATNNVAEYRGLIAGLRAVLDLGGEGSAVEARMDSKLVIEQMAGRWKVKNEGLRPLALEAGALARRLRVTWKWIPRERNTHADRLANEAMDAAARGETWHSTSFSTSGSHVTTAFTTSTTSSASSAESATREPFTDSGASATPSGSGASATPSGSGASATPSGSGASATPSGSAAGDTTAFGDLGSVGSEPAGTATAERPAATERAAATERPSATEGPAVAGRGGLGWGRATRVATSLLLLRHGQTAFSIERRFSGVGDPPLTPAGEAQAEAVAVRLAREPYRIDAIVSSPLTRARQTADAVAARAGLPVEIDKELRETDFGAWEGLTFAEIQQRWPDELAAWLADPAIAPPGGESFAVTGRRVAHARDRILATHPGQTILVVSHVTPIKLLIRYVLNAPPEALYRMHLDLACLSTIDYYADGPAVMRTFNDTAHLR